jgi:hypothetical protein
MHRWLLRNGDTKQRIGELRSHSPDHCACEFCSIPLSASSDPACGTGGTVFFINSTTHAQTSALNANRNQKPAERPLNSNGPPFVLSTLVWMDVMTAAPAAEPSCSAQVKIAPTIPAASGGVTLKMATLTRRSVNWCPETGKDRPTWQLRIRSSYPLFQ